MDRQQLQTELARFDPEVPIEAAWTPPASWYRDADFLELERQAVFFQSWQPVGRLDQVAAAGEFFAGTFLGEPYVVLRDSQGELRAFYNVCRHHAAQIVQGQGCTNELVCPYHGWTYALDGRLRSAPRLGKVEGFDVSGFGLRPIPLATWGPFVFLHFGQRPRPLEDDLRPLAERLDVASLQRLKFVAREEYKLACNWKVYVDNFLDGGYHVAHLHTGLAGQLDLEAYRTDVAGRMCIQSCAAGQRDTSVMDATALLDFAERIGRGATYAWLYPNFMINVYGPIMDTNWVVPLSADRTLTVFDYYFAETDGPRAQEFIRRSLAASHQVQVEDVGICESVQLGLGSQAYGQGRYAPRVEVGEHHFHRLLKRDCEESLQ